MIEISAHLKGQFLRLYQMAASDGDFSSTELEMLYEYALNRGVSKDDLIKILASPIGRIEVPKELDIKVTYLFDLAKMVWADGRVDEDELTTLRKYASRFEFLPENIDNLIKYLLDSVKEEKSIEVVLKEINN